MSPQEHMAHFPRRNRRAGGRGPPQGTSRLVVPPTGLAAVAKAANPSPVILRASASGVSAGGGGGALLVSLSWDALRVTTKGRVNHITSGSASPSAALEATAEDSLRAFLAGEVRDGGTGYSGSVEDRVHRDPGAAAGRNACREIAAAGWPAQPWRRFGLPDAVRARHNAGQAGSVRQRRVGQQPAPPLGAVPQCENDAGGRFTNRHDAGSHRTFLSNCLAGGVLRPRGPPARCRTGRIGRGGSDPPVRGPGTGSGRGGNSHLTPALPGSLPHQQSLAGRPSERRFGTRRINPVLLRLPPLPKLPAPLSCQRSPAWSLAPATHGGLGPDTAIRVCPYAAAAVRVSPPVHGDLRFEAAIRLAESPDAPAGRVLWPSCKGLLDP